MAFDRELNDSHLNPYRSPASSSSPVISGRGILAIVVSYLLNCALGCAFIFSYWQTIDLSIGIIRCLGFMAIMAGSAFCRLSNLATPAGRKRERRKHSRPRVAVFGEQTSPHGLLWVVLFTILFMLLKSLML